MRGSLLPKQVIARHSCNQSPARIAANDAFHLGKYFFCGNRFQETREES